MTKRAERVGLTALWLAAFAIAASAQLNPTVTVLSSPTAPAPANCDQSVAPQAVPRIHVAEIPEPPKRNANAAPPTASVRVQLKDVQNAADRGDRDAFRDTLARVKATLAAYPAGGEKIAAADVIRLYDDLDRIWTFQMESPTGAFFDATSVPAQIMRGYPGFDRAIADQTLLDAHGTRFYPTSETRDFLVREAAQRLKKLGVTVALRAPHPARILPRFATTQPKAPAPEATPVERKETKAQTATAERKPPSHRTTARKHRAKTNVAEAQKKPPAKGETTTHPSEAHGVMSKQAQPKSAPQSAPRTAEEPAVKPAIEKPAVSTNTAASTSPAPALAATPATPSAAPESETTSASSSAPTSPISTGTTSTTATAATETTASATATETTASAAATDTTGTAAKGQPQSKGVILPIILIVVGVGVLIVLFRASS